MSEEQIQQEAPESQEQEHPEALGAEAIQREIEERYAQLVKELTELYGEERVTDLVLDAYVNPRVAEFLLEAEPALRRVLEEVGPKTVMWLHHEPNGDLYLLRALRPDEWMTRWLALISPKAAEAFDQYGEQILRLIMVYPSYDEVDWDWSGKGKNTPAASLKWRLVYSMIERELQEPVNHGTDVPFRPDELDTALDAAKRRKEAGKPEL